MAPAIESIRFLISLLLTPNQDARERSPCWIGSETLPVPHHYHGACSHSVWLAKHRTAFDTHVLTGDLICLRQHPCSPVDEHLWIQTVSSTPPSLTLRRKEQQHVMNATLPPLTLRRKEHKNDAMTNLHATPSRQTQSCLRPPATRNLGALTKQTSQAV